MDDVTRKGVVAATPFAAASPPPNYGTLHRYYPTSAYLRRAARRNVPLFAFEYADGGAGADGGIAHNWSALDNVQIVPRYGVTNALPPCDVDIFGTRYSAPIGISPMGAPSIVWPGADLMLAKAAQRARIPYTLSTAGGATPEQIGAAAPDVFWFQLYRFGKNEHRIGYDLVRRAEASGARVLVMTVDVPVRTTRSRESRAGLGGEFRPDLRMLWEMLCKPRWLAGILRHGYPRFATIRAYVGENAGTNAVIRYARSEIGGAFSWDEVARYRERWKGPLVLKGIMHPADAEKAIALGVDGMIVSNHGGRQIEALPPTIDCLPAIVRTVGARATVLFDSGVRSGLDAVRALALGAASTFSGKAFLWSLAALGDQGPDYLIALLTEEVKSALGQIGAHSPAEARLATIRHRTAIDFDINR